MFEMNLDRINYILLFIKYILQDLRQSHRLTRFYQVFSTIMWPVNIVRRRQLIVVVLQIFIILKRYFISVGLRMSTKTPTKNFEIFDTVNIFYNDNYFYTDNI